MLNLKDGTDAMKNINRFFRKKEDFLVDNENDICYFVLHTASTE